MDDLSPIRLKHKVTMLLKKTTAHFALSRGARLKWCLLREEKRLFSRAIRAVIETHFYNYS